MRLCLSITFVLTCLCAEIPYASDLEFAHAPIYTEPGRPAIRDGAVLISGDRIVAVGTTREMATRALRGTLTVYDCAGLTIAAGFWNSHVHLLPPPLLHAEKQASAVLNAQIQTLFNSWGPWPPWLLHRMVAAHVSLIPTLTLFDVEAAKGHA